MILDHTSRGFFFLARKKIKNPSKDAKKCRTTNVWISVAKFLSSIDVSHLVTCNKSLSILLNGILIKWFITDRKDFGIDQTTWNHVIDTNPQVKIKIPFLMNNIVIFADIDYNARFGFAVEDIVAQICFYNLKKLIGKCTTYLTKYGTIRICGTKREKKMFIALKIYVAKIDTSLWEILAWKSFNKHAK
jgi:hypothetical protein